MDKERIFAISIDEGETYFGDYETIAEAVKNVPELAEELGRQLDDYFRIPKSYVKGKRLACEHNINRPDKKPDIDNVLKVVLDALNKVAYEDDKQVIEVICRKWYSRSSGFIKVQILEDKR